MTRNIAWRRWTPHQAGLAGRLYCWIACTFNSFNWWYFQLVNTKLVCGSCDWEWYLFCGSWWNCLEFALYINFYTCLDSWEQKWKIITYISLKMKPKFETSLWVFEIYHLVRSSCFWRMCCWSRYHSKQSPLQWCGSCAVFLVQLSKIVTEQTKRKEETESLEPWQRTVRE